MVQVNQNQKIGNKLDINEIGASGIKPQHFDPRMSMNGSIFGSGFAAQEQPAQTHEEKPEKKSLLSKVTSAHKDAKSSSGKCDKAINTGKLDVTKNMAMQKNMKVQSQRIFQQMKANNKESQELNKENKSLNEEIEALELEKETLMADDGTGIGESSAFSLKMPFSSATTSSKDTPKAASTNKLNDSKDDEKQQKIAEINGQISSKQETVKLNITKLTTFQNTNNNLKMQVDVLYGQALSQVAKTTKDAEEGAKTAQTAKVVGGATTAVGATATGAGAVMTATGWGAALGGKLLLYGGMATSAGTATNTIASLTSGDMEGVKNSGAGLRDAAGAIKEGKAAIDEANKKTQTT